MTSAISKRSRNTARSRSIEEGVITSFEEKPPAAEEHAHRHRAVLLLARDDSALPHLHRGGQQSRSAWSFHPVALHAQAGEDATRFKARGSISAARKRWSKRTSFSGSSCNEREMVLDSPRATGVDCDDGRRSAHIFRRCDRTHNGHAGCLLRRAGWNAGAAAGRRRDQRLPFQSQREHALGVSRPATRRMRSSRTRARRWRISLDAAPDEIAFGANMTTLTFHLARALGRSYGAGDEIVITELDHHANIAPWTALEKERGVTIRTAKMTRAGRARLG